MRLFWILGVALALAPAARGQDKLTVSILERMDRRMDDVNRRLVTDLQELRDAQKEIIQQLGRLDRLESQVAELRARVAGLETRDMKPPVVTRVEEPKLALRSSEPRATPTPAPKPATPPPASLPVFAPPPANLPMFAPPPPAYIAGPDGRFYPVPAVIIICGPR